MNQYYVTIRGEWRGPIDLDEMERLFDAGEISSRTLYAKEGWTTGREVGELIAARGRRDHAHPRRTEKPKQPVTAGKVVGLGCLFLVAIFFGIPALSFFFGSGGAQRETRSQSMDAHYTAEQFIMKQYPGAKSVSSYRDSIVQKDGDTYLVAVTVDGLNAFGGPVRNQLGVELRLDGDTWKLVQIKQR